MLEIDFVTNGVVGSENATSNQFAPIFCAEPLIKSEKFKMKFFGFLILISLAMPSFLEAKSFNRKIWHEEGTWQTVLYTNSRAGDHCQVVTRSENNHYLSFLGFPDGTLNLTYRIPGKNMGEEFSPLIAKFYVDDLEVNFPALSKRSVVAFIPGDENKNLQEIIALFKKANNVKFLGRENMLNSHFSLRGFAATFSALVSCVEEVN